MKLYAPPKQPDPLFSNSASPSDYVLADQPHYASFYNNKQPHLLNAVNPQSSWLFVAVLSVGGSILLLIVSVVLYDYCTHLIRTGVFRDLSQRRRSELNFYKRVELRQPSRREGAVFLTPTEDEAPSSTHWRVGSSYIKTSLDSNSDLKALPLPPTVTPAPTQPPSPLLQPFTCNQRYNQRQVKAEVISNRKKSDSDYEASSPLVSGDSSSTELDLTLLRQKPPIRFQDLKKALCVQLSPDSFLSNTSANSGISRHETTVVKPNLLRPPPNYHHPRSFSVCVEALSRKPQRKVDLPTPTSGEAYFDSGSDIPGGTAAMRRFLLTKGRSLDAVTKPSKTGHGGTLSPKENTTPMPRCRSATTIAELFILKYKMFLLEKVRRRKRAEALYRRRLRMAAFEGMAAPSPVQYNKTVPPSERIHRVSSDVNRRDSMTEETTIGPRKTKMLIHAMRIPLSKDTSLFN